MGPDSKILPKRPAGQAGRFGFDVDAASPGPNSILRRTAVRGRVATMSGQLLITGRKRGSGDLTEITRSSTSRSRESVQCSFCEIDGCEDAASEFPPRTRLIVLACPTPKALRHLLFASVSPDYRRGKCWRNSSDACFARAPRTHPHTHCGSVHGINKVSCG